MRFKDTYLQVVLAIMHKTNVSENFRRVVLQTFHCDLSSLSLKTEWAQILPLAARISRLAVNRGLLFMLGIMKAVHC